MIEFCFLGVLLMVPLAYLVLTVFQVQNAAYAVSGASRDAGRAFATSSQADAASRRAHEAARVAMADHGLELGEEALRIDCEAPKCLTPGTAVATAIAVQVPLPFVPRFLGGSIPASIRVEARHIEYVDRFRDTG